ncbi:MAG: glutamyl-tRNA reductase [bacterium]
MNFTGISINHNTAPIEIREALHLNKEEIGNFIPILKKEYLNEGFILSTCNRTEIFGFPHDFRFGEDALQKELINFKPIGGIKPEHFNRFFSCSALKHVFSVAAGIDSLIIGDSPILGQMKEAFEISDANRFSGTLAKRIFDTTLKVGKRSIRETNIGEGAVTVSYAAIQVVEKIFSALNTKSALIVGAGETGELAAVHLADKGVQNITVTNRTIERAEELAKKINGQVLPYPDFKNHLHKFDVVVSATSSDDVIIFMEDVRNMMKKRKGTPVVLMDIAIPRDIDPEVREIENVFYHDIDSLKIIVDKNLESRKKEIPAVDKIVIEEMVDFFGWYNTLQVVPTIKSFREFFEEIRNDELEKIKNKISDDDYVKLEDMTRRMIGRLLHNPTVKLRELAGSGINSEVTATHTMILKEMFNLNGSKEPEQNGE